MKRRLNVWMIVVVAGIAGCGDTPASIMRDEINLLSELADSLLTVVDEDSAKHFMETKFKVIKDRWKALNQKRQDFPKGKDQKDVEQFTKLMAESEFLPNVENSFSRIDKQIKRISAIRMEDLETRKAFETLREDSVGKEFPMFPDFMSVTRLFRDPTMRFFKYYPDMKTQLLEQLKGEAEQKAQELKEKLSQKAP